MTRDPSHPERDRELGDALRAALDDPAGDGAFVTSVLAAYRAPQPYVRDALAAWSRWGVAAAAVVVVAALLAAQPPREASASLDDALTGENESAMATLMTDDTPPGSEVLFTPSEVRP